MIIHSCEKSHFISFNHLHHHQLNIAVNNSTSKLFVDDTLFVEHKDMMTI